MKITTYGLIGLVLAGGAFALYKGGYLDTVAPEKAVAQREQGRGARTALVRVKQSQEAPFTDTVQAVGSTRARRTVDVVSEVSGRIEEITFTAGDRVEAGTVLVRLDDKSQQASLRESRAALEEARKAYERALSLFGKKFSTQAALDQARSAFERAKSAVEHAEENLAYRSIKAPFSGIVGIAKVERGSRIDSNTVIAHLDDLSEIEVEFQIPEIYLTRVATGQTVVARSDAFGDRSFEGKVTAIDSRINPASRAFVVRAAIPNPDFTLRAGMFMHLTLVLDTRMSVAVPEEAIVTENSETYVYLVADNKAVRRQVTLGKRIDGRVEVVSGMKVGEKVISSGVQNVDDGRPVRIIDAGGSGDSGGGRRQRTG